MKQLLCVALLLLSVAFGQNQPSATDATLQKAQAALEAGRLSEAIQGFEEVIAKDYSNYSAHFGLGLALYRQGDLKGAAFEFKQLTALDEKRFEGWFNLGVVQDRQGQSDEAAKSFATAVDVGTKATLTVADLKPAYVGQAKALRAGGKYDEAAKVLQDALGKMPKDGELTALLGDSLVKAGKPLDALPFLYQILASDPGNVPAIAQISDIYVAQSLPERAMRELDRGLSVVSNSSGRAQLLLKKSALLSGKAQQDALVEAARLDPKLWTAQYNLGLSRLQGGDARSALSNFQAAYAQNPDEPKILLGLAVAHDRLGNAAESGRFATMAAKMSQGADRLEALVLQGKSAYTQRRYPEAVEALGQATQLKADRATAWLYMGLSQYALKDYPSAIASLERANTLEPSASTASNLGAAYLAASKFSDAERVLTQAVTLDGRNAVAWYNLGWALRSLAREAEAKRAWQRSADLGYAPAKDLLK